MAHTDNPNIAAPSNWVDAASGLLDFALPVEPPNMEGPVSGILAATKYASLASGWDGSKYDLPAIDVGEGSFNIHSLFVTFPEPISASAIYLDSAPFDPVQDYGNWPTFWAYGSDGLALYYPGQIRPKIGGMSGSEPIPDGTGYPISVDAPTRRTILRCTLFGSEWDDEDLGPMIGIKSLLLTSILQVGAPTKVFGIYVEGADVVPPAFWTGFNKTRERAL